MSSQVRGSAIVAIAVALARLSLVLNFEVAQASKTYIVGGAKGWTFGRTHWPREMHFKAGDTLVFKYRLGQHNVLVVNKHQYRSCHVPPNVPRYRTGNDSIKLHKGHNYFMCSFPGHCLKYNMRLEVKAR